MTYVGNSLDVCFFFQSLPACMMMHFQAGLPEADLSRHHSFTVKGETYALSSVIRYRRNPNHFTTYIRDREGELLLCDQCSDQESRENNWQLSVELIILHFKTKKTRFSFVILTPISPITMALEFSILFLWYCDIPVCMKTDLCMHAFSFES